MNKIRQIFINWYSKFGRNFPWRNTKDPYKIMIAEFMLHRTKAEQVVPVYLEFIHKYPDINALATVKQEDIQYITERLGLHWRGKHFIEAAKYIFENHNGKFPDNYNDLRKIPGIGEYIAGAIMTISFNKPAPVVDSNIARFINRFWGFNLAGEIRRKKAIVKIAEKFFEYKDPGTLLFAIIDFTAIICKPQHPECKKCPFKHTCQFSAKDCK